MTGYLARLVARASGAPASATPRLPSRFETGGATENAGLDVDEAVISAVTAQTHTLPGAGDSRPGRGHARTPARVEASTTGVTEAPAPFSQDRPAAPVAASVPRDREADSTRAVERPDPAPARPLQPIAAVVRPAASVRADPADDRRSPRPESAPDVVHVSIGRIEVRATVAAPTPPAQPAKAAARRDSLSLHEYLRGERAG